MALTIRSSVMTVLVFCLVATGSIFFAYDFISNYGVALPGNLTQTLNDTNATLDFTNTWTADFQGLIETDEGLAKVGSTVSVAQSVYDIILFPFEAMKFVLTLITSYAKLLGIPEWVMNTVYAMIIFALGVAIIATLFGKRAGDT